jgi:CheY-like chemotaxis protein
MFAVPPLRGELQARSSGYVCPEKTFLFAPRPVLAVCSCRTTNRNGGRFQVAQAWDSRAPLAGRRILVVEDEYFLADDISRALQSLGSEVVGPAGDVEDAFRLLHNAGVVDGAVLDVNVRSEMIYPIARELRSRGVSFVFTTGYDKTSVLPEFQDVRLWEKPIDVIAMARALSGLIRDQA